MTLFFWRRDDGFCQVQSQRLGCIKTKEKLVVLLSLEDWRQPCPCELGSPEDGRVATERRVKKAWAFPTETLGCISLPAFLFSFS